MNSLILEEFKKEFNSLRCDFDWLHEEIQLESPKHMLDMAESIQDGFKKLNKLLIILEA